MKKILLFLAMAFLILPMVLAISVDVEKTSSKDVLIRDVNLPVIVSLDVTNNGEGDSFQFVNLLGFPMLPVEAVQIGPGETKEVKLTIYPRENFNYLGFYKFEYNIIGSDSSIVTENFILNMIELSDAFEVGSEEFNENESQIKLYIENKNNFNFGEIHAKFYSPFFEFEEDFEIGAFEKVEFDVDLKKEDFEKVMAGFYTLEVEIDIDGEVADFEGLINFEELDSLITRDRDFGWLIDTRIVEKINEGNIISSAEVVLNKNILSRLFTSLSPDPYSVDRDGLSVEYTWKTVLNPGERLEVVVKTNWLFPLLIIILVVGIVAFARKYSKTNVVLRKKVSFVKAKGGEFALKVSIFVKARK